MIAHVPGQVDMLLGEFTPDPNANQQTLDCDAVGVNIASAIGHNRAEDRNSQTMMWQAPSDADGMVDFR